ncbi:hypothetical protein EVAR_98461_1 [Eumeta japonica]|uniref:Uncharacterized protein n=1 Tax=Eumeta variegata TaxID=151549 RepID=A0A4C1YNP2_EUMVA|nr:hypothetical protein EVAR_98461_1 [Eumeta japonica]
MYRGTLRAHNARRDPAGEGGRGAVGGRGGGARQSEDSANQNNLRRNPKGDFIKSYARTLRVNLSIYLSFERAPRTHSRAKRCADWIFGTRVGRDECTLLFNSAAEYTRSQFGCSTTRGSSADRHEVMGFAMFFVQQDASGKCLATQKHLVKESPEMLAVATWTGQVRLRLYILRDFVHDGTRSSTPYYIPLHIGLQSRSRLVREVSLAVPRRPTLPPGARLSQLMALGSRRDPDTVVWMLAKSDAEMK